jgi:hypothetical protein
VQSSDKLVHWVKTKAPSDEPTVHFLVASDELQRRREDSSVGWTDGPFSSSIGWVAEKKKRRQQCRMKQRSIGGNRRSIRWSSLNKTEMRQDQHSSTGWTDGSAAVYPMVSKKPTETVWREVLQHWMNRHTVGVLRQSSRVSGSPMATWHGGHWMNRHLEKA